MISLTFEGIPHPIIVPECPELSALLERHFAHWPFTPAAGPSASTPLLSVTRTGCAYHIMYGQEGKTACHKTAACFLCDLGIDLAEAATRAAHPLLCLHCSAVAVKGNLLVFPNTNRSGKSLLAACLLRHGGKLFADDLLGVTGDGQGKSFGLPLRLRLPLPPVSTGLKEYVAASPGLADSHYRFLYPDRSNMASFGEQLPIGAFIIPKRKRGGGVTLERLPEDHALHQIMYQFQMPPGGAQTIFARSTHLAGNCPAWELGYSSAEEAVGILLQASTLKPLFMEDTSNTLPAASISPSDKKKAASPPGKRRRKSCKNTAVYSRRNSVTVHMAGNNAYLIPEEQDRIVYLNPTAFAVWQLLEDPLSEAEATLLLASIYPHIAPAELERDIAALFASLRDENLIAKPASI